MAHYVNFAAYLSDSCLLWQESAYAVKKYYIMVPVCTVIRKGGTPNVRV